MTLPALDLYDRGYTALVSVVPPHAQLAPSSKLSPSQLGKTPGKKLPNGTWAGYAWLTTPTTRDDVKQWAQDGANLGLLATHFPAVDIDCLDADLAAEITAIARRMLGDAPCRVGKAPKALLLYRLAGAPFARMALLIYPDGKGAGKPSHLVEILGAGRQFLIAGTHPSGSAYTWDRELPRPETLTPVTKEQVDGFFQELQSILGVLPGYVVERVGDGRLPSDDQHRDQTGLVAPSLDALEGCLRALPNTADTDRDTYIRIGHACRAAWPADDDEAFRIFAEWAARHPDPQHRGDPGDWRTDWRRMHPPYRVGYGWLAEQARHYGYSDAAHDFAALDAVLETRAEVECGAAALSDQWLAHRVIAAHGDQMRFVGAEQKWYVWDAGRWRPDAVNLAQHYVTQVCQALSADLLTHGATATEKKEAMAQARRVASAYCRDSVLKIMEADPRISIRPEAFDTDPWLLNTPAGLVDLRTGVIRAHTPDVLCSRMTTVAPDLEGGCPQWHAFLLEATQQRPDLIRYLQRMAGYCLTGSTAEQAFWLIWGPGGNGKSVFLNVLTGLLGDYAKTAPMDTFTASPSDRHPTELALLMGARLVTASETRASRRWDEARVKGLTGGDPISARFLYKDFFVYQPQFKLLFVGNHKPELDVVDKAMQRRIHIIPFTVTPRQVDPDLGHKLKTEWPAILGWALRGCLDWQREGLATPPAVTDATEEYFQEQDAIQRWLEESTFPLPEQFHTSEELFESWREWAGRNGEPSTGKMRGFVQRLVAKKIPKGRDPHSRRHGFVGIALRRNHPLMEAVA